MFRCKQKHKLNYGEEQNVGWLVGKCMHAHMHRSGEWNKVQSCIK